MYHKAGITDVADFYRDKFTHPTSFDFADRLINFYNLNYFKRFWIYAKVKPDSRVLDFGCGSGMLAVLKHKNCHLTGIDYSKSALEIARTINHYDETITGEVSDCDLPESSFDYIVSLDVFGHIEFEQKDALIGQLKKLLKPEGVMLHGIECANVPYDKMSSEELAQFVQVDGHVGIEARAEILQRFQKHFSNVRGEVRYDAINTIEEYLYQQENYLRQIEVYGVPLPQWLVAYMKSFNLYEREIFDVCAGLATHNMEHHQNSAGWETGGFLFVEATDEPLSSPRLEVPGSNEPDPQNLLADNNVFLRGWYGAELSDEGGYRWASRDGFIYLPDMNGRVLHLSVFSSHPQISDIPVDVLFIQIAERERLRGRIHLYSHQPVEISIPVDYDGFILKIHTATTWIPHYYDNDSDDLRELGIGIKWVYLS